MKMYNLVYKSNVLKSYKTRREAQQELDDRASLCYMLRVLPVEAYTIAKGFINDKSRRGRSRKQGSVSQL